ncbi:MAG: glycoside hydrolase family 130 protein [Mycoplasmatales bacterium]
MKRNINNPLLTPNDITPTQSNFEVDCVFNCGVTKFKKQTILLLRVAESVISEDENLLQIPVVNEKTNEVEIVTLNKTTQSDMYDFSDSRQIFDNKTGKIVYLTSLSHLRIARSTDGINFSIDDKPFVYPSEKHETWGVEDPRITLINGVYYINYTAVSTYGPSTALIKTTDFESYERMGIIFSAENKDVCIFPEKINGKYYAYHRPVPKAFGSPDMWISESPDLIHWGNNRHFLGVTDTDSWDNGRIGGGAPSFKTDKGWIHIYHAADINNCYCLGAFLTPLDDPYTIIAKTDKAILVPETKYELEGFFGNVVFACGVLVEDNNVKIYYGAADECVALAEITISEIYTALKI